MENEEILVLEEAADTSVGPEGLCCSLTFAPLRS